MSGLERLAEGIRALELELGAARHDPPYKGARNQSQVQCEVLLE